MICNEHSCETRNFKIIGELKFPCKTVLSISSYDYISTINILSKTVFRVKINFSPTSLGNTTKHELRKLN